MREDQLARDIVANLAWRYRFAREATKSAKKHSERLHELCLESECEAWNAYVSSRLMLFREEGVNVL